MVKLPWNGNHNTPFPRQFQPESHFVIILKQIERWKVFSGESFYMAAAARGREKICPHGCKARYNYVQYVVSIPAHGAFGIKICQITKWKDAGRGNENRH